MIAAKTNLFDWFLHEPTYPQYYKNKMFQESYQNVIILFKLSLELSIVLNKQFNCCCMILKAFANNLRQKKK